MPSTPAAPRTARLSSVSVWWLALGSGMAIFGATAFLWGQRAAETGSVGLNPEAPTVIYVPREVARETPVPVATTQTGSFQSQAVVPPEDHTAGPTPLPQIVYVDRPVPVPVEVRVEVEKPVVVEREVLVPVVLPPDPRLLAGINQGDAPQSLPAWLKIGALVFWYQPDGSHRSGKVTATNSDFVVVAWSTGKSQHSADFARQHFERKARPRTQPPAFPAATAEEEVVRKGVSRGDAAQQEKLNAAWSNRRR